jgi:hypothetical protein
MSEIYVPEIDAYVRVPSSRKAVEVWRKAALKQLPMDMWQLVNDIAKRLNDKLPQ